MKMVQLPQGAPGAPSAGAARGEGVPASGRRGLGAQPYLDAAGGSGRSPV